MDKQQLKRYEHLENDIRDMKKRIDKLYDRKAEIPTVYGKVTGSSHEFPYTKIRTTVSMDEPAEAEKINKKIRELEKRIENDRKEIDEIESFIFGIEDPQTRQIFEKTFLDGRKQVEVAEMSGYSKGRISQIITDYLKD